MKTCMRSIVLFALWIGWCSQTQAAQTILVGGYVFPPYVEMNRSTYHGLTLDLIDAMNAFQRDLYFKFVLTSPPRRYEDFENNKFDAIFFEDIGWGWQGKGVEASRVFLKDGEVFITKASPDKTQAYFQDLAGKSIAGCIGYHYAFADFNAEPKFLEEHFKMQLSDNHQGNIKKVLIGRADLAIVTKSYLQGYLKNHPEDRDHILISAALDQEYRHTILLRKGGTLTVETINRLLDDMEQQGILSQLWKQYGLE